MGMMPEAILGKFSLQFAGYCGPLIWNPFNKKASIRLAFLADTKFNLLITLDSIDSSIQVDCHETGNLLFNSVGISDVLLDQSFYFIRNAVALNKIFRSVRDAYDPVVHYSLIGVVYYLPLLQFFLRIEIQKDDMLLNNYADARESQLP